jgi:hypothetical protein
MFHFPGEKNRSSVSDAVPTEFHPVPTGFEVIPTEFKNVPTIVYNNFGIAPCTASLSGQRHPVFAQGDLSVLVFDSQVEVGFSEMVPGDFFAFLQRYLCGIEVFSFG